MKSNFLLFIGFLFASAVVYPQKKSDWINYSSPEKTIITYHIALEKKNRDIVENSFFPKTNFN